MAETLFHGQSLAQIEGSAGGRHRVGWGSLWISAIEPKRFGKEEWAGPPIIPSLFLSEGTPFVEPLE